MFVVFLIGLVIIKFIVKIRVSNFFDRCMLFSVDLNVNRDFSLLNMKVFINFFVYWVWYGRYYVYFLYWSKIVRKFKEKKIYGMKWNLYIVFLYGKDCEKV